MSRRVTLGARSASPAATVRIALSSSSSGRLFSAKPLAPASSASKTYSSRSNVVRMSTRGALRVPVGGDLPRRLDPVHDRHPDVHDHDVRREAGRELDRLPAVGRPADDGQVILGVDQRRERGAEQLLVVDDQDGGGHAAAVERDLGEHAENLGRRAAPRRASRRTRLSARACRRSRGPDPSRPRRQGIPRRPAAALARRRR